MVLRNSRSIQKHGTGCELSYCYMREAECAFAWRSHVTKSCLSWDIPDVTSCNALTSRRVALTSRRVSLWRHVFTSRPTAIRHIHVKFRDGRTDMHDEGGQERHWTVTDKIVQKVDQCVRGKRRFTISILSEKISANFEDYFVSNCHGQIGLP